MMLTWFARDDTPVLDRDRASCCARRAPRDYDRLARAAPAPAAIS